MRLARSVIAVVLFAVFALFALANGVLLLMLRRSRAEGVQGGPSFLPVFGGIAGALACVIAPVPGLARWAFLPLFVDVGCVPLPLVQAILDARRK